MNITDILNRKSIEVGLKVENKKALLEKMMDLAVESGNVIDEEETKKEIYEREKIMSTGVGKGIALPHAKTNAVKETIGALAILETPLEYDALDNKPVSIVFLLLGRENNVGNHLRLLSKISRLMNNDSFRERILNSKSSDEILATFAEIEDKI